MGASLPPARGRAQDLLRPTGPAGGQGGRAYLHEVAGLGTGPTGGQEASSRLSSLGMERRSSSSTWGRGGETRILVF